MYEIYTQKKIDQLVSREVKKIQKVHSYYNIEYIGYVIGIPQDGYEGCFDDYPEILITLHATQKPDAPAGEKKLNHEFITRVNL